MNYVTGALIIMSEKNIVYIIRLGLGGAPSLDGQNCLHIA